MGEEFEVGARLELKNLTGFVSGMRSAGRAVDDVGDQARGASRSLGVMASVGRGAMRFGLSAIRWGAIGAAGAMGVLAYKGINAASDLGESINKTNVIFGTAAKGVQDWSKTTATSFGISRQSALDFGAGFGGMFKSATGDVNEAAKLSRETVELGADLSSFFNAEIPDTLNALRSGLSGESEPLRRFNIFLNETSTAAAAVKYGIAAQGQELTDQQKILARYHSILEQTKDAQGDFGRTLETSLPNTMKVIQASFQDAIAQLGQGMLPTVFEVAKVVSEVLGPALKDIQPGLTAFVSGIGAAVGPLLTAIGPLLGSLGEVFGLLGRQLGPVLEQLGPILADTITQAMPGLKILVRALAEGLGESLMMIAPLLPDLVKQMVRWERAMRPLIPIVIELGGSAIALAVRALTWLMKLGNWFIRFPRIAFEFGAKVGLAFRAIPDALRSALNSAISWWNQLSFTLDVPDILPGPSSYTINTPDIPQLQHGGHATAMRPHLVGEAGPELFVPRSDGHVVSNDDLRGLSRPQRPLIVQVMVDRREIGRAVIADINAQVARA